MNAKQWMKDHRKEIILVAGAGAIGAFVGVNVTKLRGNEKALFETLKQFVPKKGSKGYDPFEDLNDILEDSNGFWTIVPTEEGTKVSDTLEYVKRLCEQNNWLESKSAGIALAMK